MRLYCLDGPYKGGWIEDDAEDTSGKVTPTVFWPFYEKCEGGLRFTGKFRNGFNEYRTTRFSQEAR